MELRHLRYFVAVAESGHMTRAAARLGIQQPPLSKQIRALESSLGTTLFRRHPKGVALTDNGKVFLEEARHILDGVATMEARMARVAKGLTGRLAIGFTSSAAAHAFTPETLRACRSRHPEIELVLTEGNAAEVTESVAGRRLHCAFLRVPVLRPEGVVLETLLDEPVVVAVPVDHRLARGRTTVALQDLDGENLILVRRPGAPGLYANLLSLCDGAGSRPVVVAEVERMMTSLNLVAAGAGITVVPASMAHAHPHAIVYRRFRRDVPLDAPLTLAWRADAAQGAVATFVALARTIARRVAARGA
jgi:DNA-binding transcriptional LysR family regulator